MTSPDPSSGSSQGPQSGGFPGSSEATSYVPTGGAPGYGAPNAPASGQIPAQSGQWSAQNPGPQYGGGPYDPNTQYDPNAQYNPNAQYDPNSQYGPNPQYDPNSQYGAWGPQGYAPRPRPDLWLILALASVLAGIITYFMGFVSWLSLASGVEDEADEWSTDLANGDIGVPGFFSYEILLNPGKFLIVLGAVAVATTLVLVPRYRKALPFLAVIATAGWLALFAAALALPPVVELGAGAIVALIFGFLQVALLLGASFVFGLKRDEQAPATAAAH